MPFTILLVDDEEPVCEYLSRLLESRGHHVETADCGSAALEVLRTSQIDLLITDCALETMTGFEIAIQAARQRPSLRVLFISGYAGSEILRLYGAKLAGLPFLQKPFGAQEFIDVAESLLKGDPISPDQIQQLASISD